MDNNAKPATCDCGQPAMAGHEACWDCTRNASGPALGGAPDRFWNDARMDELKGLLAKRLSASQIAARITLSSGKPTSRNAVIGIVKRRGLVFETTQGYSKVTHAGSVAARRTSRPAKPQNIAKKPALPPPMPVSAQIDRSSVESRNIKWVPPAERKKLVDLSANECRWPFGDVGHAEFGFCGCKTFPGLPYCEDHARAAFQPPRGPGRPAGVQYSRAGGNLAIVSGSGAPEPKNPASEPLTASERVDA